MKDVLWYSNRMRGDRQRADLSRGESEKAEAENSEVIVISNFRTKKDPPLVWHECIKKVWEVDLLLCSHCGSLMNNEFHSRAQGNQENFGLSWLVYHPSPLQAGAQSFGYALFFVDDESLNYLKASQGWEIGVGPTIVVVEKGPHVHFPRALFNQEFKPSFSTRKG